MNKLDLKVISKALKEGKNEILENIYKDNRDYCINKLVLDKQSTREEAEDIYIESIINFREKVLTGKVSYLTNIKYYLAQTCINMFLKRLEHKKRWDKNMPDVERFFYDSDYLLPDANYNTQEALSITRKAWNALKDKCKDIIHYFYIDKLKMEEIAEIMGFANAAVAKTTKMRCHKKMLDIARKLKKNPQSL